MGAGEHKWRRRKQDEAAEEQEWARELEREEARAAAEQKHKQRQKTKTAMLKRTKRGQPVMKHRMGMLLEKLQGPRE